MKFKIENIKVQSRMRGNSGSVQEFVVALRELKVGQSFLYRLASNDRTAISIVQYLLDREFSTRREGEVSRIGRIA